MNWNPLALLYKKVPQKEMPSVAEVAWSESSMYKGANFPKYNPDGLIGRKGFKVYQRMMTDEQVKAVVRFKRDAVTSRDFTFECEHPELSDKEREFRSALFMHIVSSVKGSFTDALNGIMSSMYNGFSMTEKMHGMVEFMEKSWVGLDQLKLRPADTFFFHVNMHGTVQRLVQKLGQYEQDLELPKFIHYVQNPDFDEHYGRSELREAYRAWFSKDMIIKFQNIHMERFATGFVWVQPKEGQSLAPNSQEYTQLQTVLTNLTASSAFILPGKVEMHVEHPASTDMFERKVAQEDKAIAKALLVPNLLGITEQGSTGAYAQSQTQLKAFFWTLAADVKRLEDALNEQLFRELGDLNFGDGYYPKFKFAPISDEQMIELIKTWSTLVSGGAVQASDTDEAYLRKLLGMPEKGEPLVDPNALQPGSVPGKTDIDPETGMPIDPKTGKPMNPEQMEETIVGKLGITVGAFRKMFGFNPDQPRDERGRWGESGGGDRGDGDATRARIAEVGLSDRIMSLEQAGISTVYRNENIDDFYKGKAIWGEGKYYSLDEASANKLTQPANRGDIKQQQLDPRLTILDIDMDYSKDPVAAGKVYEQFGELIMDAQKTGVDISKTMKAAGIDGIVIRSNQQAYGYNQVVIFPEDSATNSASRNIRSTAFSRAMKRVDFAVINSKAEDSSLTTAYDVAAINSEAVARLMAQAEELKLGTADGDPKDVEKLKFTPEELGKMKQVISSGLKDAWLIGESHARRELQKASSTKFAVNDLALQDAAASYFKAQAFKMTGNISGATLSTIKSLLLEGIKTSKAPDETRKAIYKALEAEGMLTDEAVEDALGTRTVKDTKARISTVVRTNSFEAINEARYQFFSDPGLNGFVEALEYSAILDDRTTEICSQLDGQTYSVDDAVWSTYRPPNHYNCRSILVPITQRDTWSASEPPTVMPQKGFGFSRCDHNHGGEHGD